MEISHRTKQWDAAIQGATSLIYELLGLSDDYKVLWLQGGASTQFYMVPTNIRIAGKPMEYVDTGTWSTKAIREAKLFGDVKVVATSEAETFSYVPKDVSFSSGSAYAHITSNNTIYGTQWQYWPETPDDVPLVCDMSSDLLARKIDAKRFGVIYAGAQKNLGPAGATLVVVREDLLERVPDKTPSMQKWSTYAGKGSMFNTPAVFPIYICKLSLEYLKETGGVTAMEKHNEDKAKILYDVIDKSDGFYKGHAQGDSRSLMNVTFRLPSEELETKCVEEALTRDLVGLKGHRSVGGMRASIYNAMTQEGVKALAEFLMEFKDQNH